MGRSETGLKSFTDGFEFFGIGMTFAAFHFYASGFLLCRRFSLDCCFEEAKGLGRVLHPYNKARAAAAGGGGEVFA